MNNLYRAFIVLLICTLSLQVSAAVTASLDNEQINRGESFQLTLLHEGRTNSEPDLAPLKRDFDIVGRSGSSSVQIVNGNISSQVQFRLTLIPKHPGKIKIPSLRWNDQQSPVLEITVGESNVSSQEGNGETAKSSRHFFINSEVDQKQPYVQASVVLTARIYTDQPLRQANLNPPSGNGVIVQQLGKDELRKETRDGRNYQVVERKYLLIPQQSGAMKLDGPVLDAEVPDIKDNDDDLIPGHAPFANILTPTKPVRLYGDPVVLNVRPRPASETSQDWLPAQQVTLQETWRPADLSVRVGDPLTRQLRLDVVGVTAAQLPDLAARLTLPDGIKAYPDQAKLDTSSEAGKLTASRHQDIALIASRPGQYVLPALQLSWWDTTKNVKREVVLPEQLLEILPAVGAANEPSSTVVENIAPAVAPQIGNNQANASLPDNGSLSKLSIWRWLSAVFAFLWIITLIAWWRSRRMYGKKFYKKDITAASPNDEVAITSIANARNAFQQACRDNDPQKARQSLLTWARIIWPQNVPIGLSALSKRLNNAELSMLLRQLDRACYLGGEWAGDSLSQVLKELRPKKTEKHSAPLMPDSLYISAKR